jgi:hypothetical protein
MPSRPVILDGLLSDLRRVELWLNFTLGVAVEESDDRETPDPFSPPDDLANLKKAIDRIRPLLWVYLNRQNETKHMAKGKKPANVRSLMEEAINISDRYVGRGD